MGLAHSLVIRLSIFIYNIEFINYESSVVIGYLLINNHTMSNPFFEIDTLMKGGHQMLELIKECAE